MSPRVRVLVVDDSPFARKVLRETLASSDRIDVVGHATDGLDALEKIVELAPDVVTMDLHMPGLDGVGVLRTLQKMPRPPRVLVVTTEDNDAALAVSALQEGAFDLVVKPSKIASDRLYEIGRSLVDKVLATANADGAAVREKPMGQGRVVGATAPTSAVRLVVVGASTGGPRAVTHLLKSLPATFPAPIAIVVHMPPGFTASFAERLDTEVALHVREASDGAVITPGEVAIGRAGEHLAVVAHARGAMLSVSPDPRGTLHCPSVDVLFSSAARAFGRSAVGIVMTGMGDDGLAGSRALHAAGAPVLVESEATAVVYGMPRVVAEAKLAAGIFALEEIPAALSARCREPRVEAR